MEQTAVFAKREVVGADEVQFISTRLSTRAARAEAARAANESQAAATPLPLSSAPPLAQPAPASHRTDVPFRAEMPSAAPFTEESTEDETEPVTGGLAAPIFLTGSDESLLNVPDAPALARESMPSTSTPPASTPPASQRKGAASQDEHPLVLRIPVGTTLAEAERLLIIKTLEVAEGNKQRAARILGISRRGLYTKLAS